MEHTRNVGLSAALVGSLWAAHREKCQECGVVPKLWGHSLTKLGLAFYSLALVANFFKLEQLPLVLKSAAYMHGLLVVHMILTHQICPACLLVAIGAITAAQKVDS